VLAPQPRAGTCDDGDPVIKTNIHLDHSPLEHGRLRLTESEGAYPAIKQKLSVAQARRS
jgi:hypothetical protein